MKTSYSKIFFVLLLSLVLFGLTACSDNDDTPKSSDEKKTAETTKKETPQTVKEEEPNVEQEEPQSEEKEVTNLVLNSTNIVQVTNLAKKTNEHYPDLGPFFVVRGIDIRGIVSEVWINDMKIFEMGTNE